MRDSQARVESTRKGRTRGLERGLCHGVVLLLEDERDDIAGLGSLVMKVCLQPHDSKWCVRPTTKEGLYWMSPSGPPATTSIWAAFAGRADRRPSKVESAKSLENMTSVFEERRQGLIEIERKKCLMRHQWPLRWTLYLKTIGLSALQSRDDRQGHDESPGLQDNQVRHEVSGNPVPRRCACLHACQEVCKGVLRLRSPDKDSDDGGTWNSTSHSGLAGSVSGPDGARRTNLLQWRSIGIILAR